MRCYSDIISVNHKTSIEFKKSGVVIELKNQFKKIEIKNFLNLVECKKKTINEIDKIKYKIISTFGIFNEVLGCFLVEKDNIE